MSWFKKNIDLLLITSATVGAGVFYDKLYPFHVLLAFFILFRARTFLPLKSSDIYLKFWYLIIGYNLIRCLGVQNTMLGLKHISLLCFGFCIIHAIMLFVKRTKNIHQLCLILGVVFGFEVLVSTLEVVTHFRWPFSPYSNLLSWFGKGDLYTNPTKLIENWSIRSVATGFRWNPNNLSVSLAILFPFGFLIKKNWLKLMFFLPIPFIIYFNESRAVILSIAIMLIIWFSLYLKKNWTNLKIKLTALVCFFAISFSFVFIPALNQTFTNATKAVTSLVLKGNENDGSSTSVRAKLYNDAFTSFLEHYGMGIGPGQSVLIQSSQKSLGLKVKALHNFWLEILVEGGLILFTLVILAFFYLLNQLYKIYKHYNPFSNYALACLISLIGFAIGGISCSSIFYFFPMWILLGFSSAILYLYHHENTSINGSKQSSHLQVGNKLSKRRNPNRNLWNR